MNNVVRTGSNPMAFYIKNEGNRSNCNQHFGKYHKKDCPICTYCGFTGHAIDKCYKLHGYPPGYKARQKVTSPNQTVNAVANQISESSNHQGNIDDFVQTLNSNQYQHILAMLNSHLASAKVDTGTDVKSTHTSGISFSVSNNPMLHSSRHWIVDSGAINHVCFDQSLFQNIVPISNSFVTLPNNFRIQVNFSGSIQLSPSLILYNVLYVPQFHFNLLSVTSPTRNSSIQVKFLTYCCIIQETHTLKMIGRDNKVANLYVIDSAYCFISSPYITVVTTCNP